ncbi:MAG: type II toxin-antitoxin system Phd/YefM family antitoxin [Mediterranea sp.]|jgi:PHD/YefM family antitoxin component YafN of YafNO toxin-antitoxin module|nr:type II toxin-antitoxin system Phd/YefM family antitoxin [Mediterranea sp.]
MQIITAREFRANQDKYFDLAEKEPVFVTRRRGNPVCINIAREEDIPTPMELESIQRGLEDIHNSRTYEMRQDETLDEFLNRVEPCIE